MRSRCPIAPTGLLCLCLTIAASLGPAGCTTPRIATTITGPDPMMMIGDPADQRSAFERRHGGCASGEQVAMLSRVARRLLTHGWTGPAVRPSVLLSAIPNAYVLPTGHLYVTNGLLEMICTDDELAAVLAHELGHLIHPNGFDVAGLSTGQRLDIESQTDLRAVEILIDAGYDALALSTMIQKLESEQPPGWAQHRRAELQAALGLQPDDIPQPRTRSADSQLVAAFVENVSPNDNPSSQAQPAHTD